MPGLPQYRQGRLIWAWLRSGSQKKERHPAVIISADSEIIQPERFDPRKDIDKVNAVAVVGVSTQFKRYPPYVPLPYLSASGGHPTTKLTEECGACIGWYDWVILEDDVIARGGDVPAPELERILEGVAQDLGRRLAVKADQLSKELTGLSELLARLIGEP